MKIDDKDRKIMDLLLKDARLSYRQLARSAGVSVATAINRVRNLEKEGVIKGYAAVIDYSSLGYEIDVLISVKIGKGKFHEVWKKFLTIPEVMAVYDTTGDFDAVLVAKFRNTKGLDSYLKKLQAYEFVEKTHTVLVLNTVKERQMAVA